MKKILSSLLAVGIMVTPCLPCINANAAVNADYQVSETMSENTSENEFRFNIEGDTDTSYVGLSEGVELIGVPDDETIEFKVSDEKICKITYADNTQAVIDLLEAGELVITAVSSGGKTAVMTLIVEPIETEPTPLETIIKGDINADGEFTVADAVALQKWLLGYDIELKNWKAADLCEDDKLDAFDLCLMKKELINCGIIKRNMTQREFFEIITNNDEFTWSDFEQYKSEDIGSGIYLLRYEIDMESKDKVYLYLTGSSMDEKPDDIYLMRTDEPTDEDYEKADIYELKNFLRLLGPPDNTEKDRENAQKIADYAFNELKSGNFTVGEDYDSTDINDPELSAAYEKNDFHYFEFISENTFMIKFQNGLWENYGYLITDGTVEYELGKQNVGNYEIKITDIYDNIYYFIEH